MKEALACESRSFFCAQSGRTAYGIVRDGYFVSSVGNDSQETIRKYIESQGQPRYPAFFILCLKA